MRDAISRGGDLVRRVRAPRLAHERRADENTAVEKDFERADANPIVADARWAVARFRVSSFEFRVRDSVGASGHFIQFPARFLGGFRNWLHQRSEERRVGKECRSRWS